jgi:phage-related protein
VLGQVFRSVKVYIAQLWSALQPLAPFIQNILWPLLKGFAMGALGGLVVALRFVIPVVRVLATVLGWIGTKAAPLAPWFQRLGFAIGFLVSPLTKVIGVGGRLVQLLVRFISIVGRVIGVVGRLGPRIGGALSSAFRAAVGAAGKLIDGFRSLGSKLVQAIVNGIKSAPGALLDAIKSMLPGGKAGALIRKVIPGMASGGYVASTGLRVVGEAGPELLSMPGGSRVTPMPRYAMRPAPALGGVSTTAHFYIDRRHVATAGARDTADRKARR